MPVTLPPDLPYGITLYVIPNSPPTLPSQTITDLTNLGNGQQGMWLRYQYQWDTIEYAQGQYNWSQLDTAVQMCNAAGINMCWNIQSAPTWYKTISATDGSTVSAGSGQLPDPVALANFAQIAAARYNGQAGHGIIRAIQIGNEEYDTFNPRDLQSQWLTLAVQKAAPAIRVVYPSCLIGICALRKTTLNATSHIQNWVSALFTYNGGCGGLFDWFDFHYYRDNATAGPDPTTYDANTPSVAQELQQIQQICTSFGFAPQIWCAETGWNTYSDTSKSPPPPWVTQAQQSQYTLDMYDALRKGGATHCFLFTMTSTARAHTLPNGDPGSTEPKSITQLVNGTTGLTYLPAYSAIQGYIAMYPTWPAIGGSGGGGGGGGGSGGGSGGGGGSSGGGGSPPFVVTSAPAVVVPRFGIGTYQPLQNSASLVIGGGFPTQPFQLANPYAGLYGGTYGYLVDTTIKQPQQTTFTPAAEIGLDTSGQSVIRGYPQITWVYTTMRPDHWYYLQWLYQQSARTPNGFQFLVLLQYPDPGGTNTPIQVLARMEPPLHSARTVGAFLGVTLHFTYVGQSQLIPSVPIQILTPSIFTSY